MQALVTGASGYIGSALADALAAHGVSVIAQRHRGELPPGVAQAFTVDLVCDVPSDLVAGVEVVYHLAGIAHRRAAEADYEALNLRATLNLAEAALRSGVRRFVFVSSTKAARVVGGSERIDAYAESKWQAEQALLRLCDGTAMELLIVRPALVYALPLAGNLRRLQRWADRRLPAPPRGGSRAMIARDDLVHLLIALGSTPVCAPLTVTVCDGQQYSTRRLFEALISRRGLRPLLPALPAGAWRVALRLMDLLTRESPGTHWDRLFADEPCAPSNLGALCGFAPRWQFESFLRAQSGPR